MEDKLVPYGYTKHAPPTEAVQELVQASVQASSERSAAMEDSPPTHGLSSPRSLIKSAAPKRKAPSLVPPSPCLEVCAMMRGLFAIVLNSNPNVLCQSLGLSSAAMATLATGTPQSKGTARSTGGLEHSS